MSQHRDPDVAEALRRLDVPDHGPDFWAALEARLADEDLATDPGEVLDDDGGADVIDLGAAREASGRRSRPGRLPAAAAAAAAAAVAALALGIGLPAAQQAADGDAQLDTATVPQDQDPGPTTPAPTDPVITEPAPGMSAQAAEDLAQDWLDTLFAGDVAGAYERLDDTSTERMPFDEFELLGSGLFEGAAAFAQDGISRSVQVLTGPEGDVAVVTFSGDVEREGMIETASYPVVVTPTGIHFTLDGPQLELDTEYADSSGTTLTSPLVALVDGAAQVTLWYDGGEPVRLVEAGRVSIDVEAAAGAGTHLVNVVAIQGELITARAWTVVVP